MTKYMLFRLSKPVWAISALDPSERFLARPYEDIETRFSFGVAHGAFDTESDLLYTADTGTGYVSAMSCASPS